MSPPRFEPASLFFRTFAAGGLISVAALSLVDRGATRAYLTPWNGLLWLAQIAPIAALLLRLSSRQRPFRLPSHAWCWAVAVACGTVLISGVMSPYRGPSLLGGLTLLAALATFLLIHDWWRQQPAKTSEQFTAAASWFALALCAMSFGQWIWRDLITSDAFLRLSTLLTHRNDHPLGHSNYTAGMAVLILPWVGLRVWLSRGWLPRLGWTVVLLLPVAMLFSSGSRGGMLGLAALVAATLWWSRLGWKKLGIVTIAALSVATALVYAHPRTRALLRSPGSSVLMTAASDIQRSAMAHAGARMGADRPVLGWGTGVTPFVYPRYRAGLEGGAENVLQLHSMPVQVWADFGALGAAGAIWFLFLFARRALALRNSPSSALANRADRPLQGAALLSLLGYFVFSLTDYQLDVPFFAFAVAASAALVAAPNDEVALTPVRNSLLLATLASVVVIGIWARPAQEPALNVHALALAQEPTQTDQAIALLNQSLALNPQQEIAHFNLGWLLLVRDPAQAEEHFVAATKLVPDKGGVYFGVALARLNQGHREPAAARALAVECINDPLFLTSPWWREPAIAALHDRTMATLQTMCADVAAQLDARSDRRAREARYVAALARWIDGEASPGEILREAHTSERVSYFAARPTVPTFSESRIRSYRRERTGYPVLMRDLDLAPPIDVFDVRESILATDHLPFLFPAKGWLPSPLLLKLLEKK